MFCGRLNKLKFLLLLHFFTVISVLCFIKKVYASDIEFSLDSLPNASNGYGGVSIDLNLSGIKNKDYTYEIKRSSDGIYWQNIGLGFEYNKHDSAVYPHKIRVLNVYPDNDSFVISEELKKKYKDADIEIMKKVYAVQNGKYEYTDGRTATLPASATLRLWIEGGKYSEKDKTFTYEDLSVYNGFKMLEISQMSMKKFNNNIKSIDNLKQYDTIFFGTWDANCWNDLNKETYRIVREYIKSGRGVIFGHDTIGYEIADKGIFTGNFEHENMCNLYDLAGFNKIPKKYANASFSKKNDYENYLPIDYQIWGGSNLNKSVTVRFSKSKRVEDSALTTFPYNLLSENGAYRDLNVPQTHTSWMGLVKNENNIVSFVNNDYDILPEKIRKAYSDNPNLKYNWYLSSVSSNYACYAIQTGHRRNESLSDERKLIANVLCSSYRKESVGLGKADKFDASAQDMTAPKVYTPEITLSENNKVNMKFNGEDFGNKYFYYVDVKDLENQLIDSSDYKSIEIITGIKSYYYILDNESKNKDFDINKAAQILKEDNENGITMSDCSAQKKFLHIKAIDYAGNISEPVVIDLSKLAVYGIYPVEITTDKADYLYYSGKKNEVRQYYLNAKAEFDLKGGCYVLPFAAIDIQPYQNQIGRQWILTPLDNNVGDNNNSHYKNKHIDNLIDAMTINQSRENNSSQLKYIIHGKFRDDCDGKNSLISPNGLISVNKSLKLITAKNNDKINVICDGKGPAIKVENLKSWYNKSDYSEAFKIKLNCKDEGAGVKNTILQLDYYGDYSWKKLDSKETKREDDCLDYFTYSKEGQFMYRILAYDNVGNITSIRSSFAVDLNAPVINDLQSEYGWSNSDISVNVKAVDNLSGVSNIRIYNNNDELINQIYSDTAEILFTEEQKELYYMVAEDKAGNVSDKYYFVVKIDKTAPQINIDDLESEAHISEENKSYYCLSGNAINITAKDEDENQIYSGIKRLVLKSQDNKSINSVENYDNNIVINNILNLKYDVTTSAESDYYIAVAIDGAGNISKKYIIPQICMSNRIRRYILHDNYEEQYGYYRIYE